MSENSVEAKVQRALEELLSQETGKGRRSELRQALDKHRELVQQAIRKGLSPSRVARAVKAAGAKESLETIRGYVQEVGKVKTLSARKPRSKGNSNSEEPTGN